MSEQPKQQIEQVDNLPIIIHWLLKMQVDTIIDQTWHAHTNWHGVSYGQLSVLFITYVIHQRNHRLSGMEQWVKEHRIVLEQITGWSIGDKDATDDRLGRMLFVLGSDEGQSVEFQRQLGGHLIQAYELPTEVGRYDTSSFNVHHAPSGSDEPDHELLRFGYSKDKRPDLLQFKQGLGTLDPAGMPIITRTLSGETADDGLYLGAWGEMYQIIGHKNWLYIADSKAAAILTRATLDHKEGHYLFPMPMTGKTPEWVREQVLNPPSNPEPIYLPGVVDKDEKPKAIGQGFVVKRTMETTLADGTVHSWDEQWFVSQSFAHAQRAKEGIQRRLSQTVDTLSRMRAKSEETVVQFQQRADKVVEPKKMGDYLTVTAQETITSEKQYLKPGRPSKNSPFKLVEKCQLSLDIQINQPALDQASQLAGWRAYVSNDKMSLSQAAVYYRGEWLVESGFHRFKGGSLPVLPLFLRIPERIIGLMLLLTVALQALTLLEFVARRSLADQEEEIEGLVPYNPKVKTKRPTAERMLDAFRKIHLVVVTVGTQVVGYLSGTLTPLQLRILALLGLPDTIFDLAFSTSLQQFF